VKDISQNAEGINCILRKCFWNFQ